MEPTIGRGVLVHGPALPGMNVLSDQPVYGKICAVHSPSNVTVAGFDHLAVPFAAREIEFVQDGDPVPSNKVYATFMPMLEKRKGEK